MLVFSRVKVKVYSKMETSRFVEITFEELSEFVEEQENPNTKKKTAYDVAWFTIDTNKQLTVSLCSQFQTLVFEIKNKASFVVLRGFYIIKRKYYMAARRYEI